MARVSRYFLPHGIRRLWPPVASELKLFARTWLNVLLPWRLLRYRGFLAAPHKKLHVGCGSKRFPGWINLDMNPKGDFTLDLREGLPFADGCVERIYTEHSLEHFRREDDGPFLLAECLRVLEPGGRLRVTVPDGAVFMDYYAGRLDAERAEAVAKTHSRFAGTPMDVVNSGFRWKHQHQYIYDTETLTGLLEELGYSDVRRRGFDETDDAAFAGLDLAERRFETLYLEARKPA